MLGEKYATFDNENRQNKEGIGLGLSICKDLSAVMGNFVNQGPLKCFKVFSIEGQGTRVGILLYVNENQFADYDFKID